MKNIEIKNLENLIKKKLHEFWQIIEKNLNSVKSIDEANLKIAEFNNSFKKLTNEIRKLFSIPQLKEQKDIYIDTFVVDEGKSYEIPKSKWFNSLSKEEKEAFRASIFNALKEMKLSYALYDWLEKYVLYRKKEKFDESTYFIGILNLLSAIDEKYPFTTGEKRILKKQIRLFLGFKEGRLSKKDLEKYKIYKRFLNRLKKISPRNERRKPKVDIALKTLENYGKEECYFEPTCEKWEKIKISDKELAAKFSEDYNSPFSSEAIKKLRHRYKRKVEK